MKILKRIGVLALLSGILFLPRLDVKIFANIPVRVESKSVTVYMTKTGKKYYLGTCS